MFVGILSAIAMATASASSGMVHHTQVEHRGARVPVSYVAETKVSTKQIGSSFGPRPSTERCLWTARVSVSREATGSNGAKLSHRLDADRALSGNQHGSCLTGKKQIGRDVAARSDTIRAHLADVAQQDRPRLVADLDAAMAFASN